VGSTTVLASFAGSPRPLAPAWISCGISAGWDVAHPAERAGTGAGCHLKRCRLVAWLHAGSSVQLRAARDTPLLVSDAKRREVDADEGLVDLAADAGGEEVLFEWVGEADLGHDVACECQVDPGVGPGAGDPGEA